MALHGEGTVPGDIVFQITVVHALEQLFKGGGLEIRQHDQHTLAGAQAHIGLGHGGFVAGKQHPAVLHPDVFDIQPAQLVTGDALQSKQTGDGKFKVRHNYLL